MSFTIYERWDEVTPPNNMCWIQKSKSKVICIRNKTNFGEFCMFFAKSLSRNHTQPANPEKLHSVVSEILRTMARILDICMVNTKNRCIPERMGILFGFRRQHHYEWMGFWINCVKVSAHVIGGVVDTDGGKAVDDIVSYTNRISIIIRKWLLSITIEPMPP